MTVVVLCCSLLLAWLCGDFVSDLGGAATRRTRAQIAADAAALAAIAASVPGAPGSHGALAREYAVANGATLVHCHCLPGATSIEVGVEVGGVHARARAVLDQRLLGPREVPAGGGLRPAMRAAVDRLLHAARGAVWVVSARRSTAQQADLWAEAVERYGSAAAARRWVAPPGHSMHERGLAVDLAGNLDLAARLVRALGLPLHRPLGHEPWHFELVAGRGP